MADVAILIPALNCAVTIGAVVAAARGFAETVLVVDDGSTDGTGGHATAAGAVVVRHEKNLGKGAALRTGLRWLAEAGFARAVAMDGDGQHLCSEIRVLLETSDHDPEALVIGTRRVDAQRVAIMKLWANRAANVLVAVACGQRLPDTQSGFRVYPVRATLALGVRSGHFAFETEVLIRAVRAGMRLRGVPVDVHYPRPENRASHYRPLQDTLRILRVVMGLMLRAW